jgi:membrane protein DedA with SNARE-associated domain
VNEILDWLLNTVQSVDPTLRNLLAGLAIMLETSLFVGLVMPGDTVVLVASTGVANLADFFWLLGAVLLGSLIGESIGFGIGRLFGERIRRSKFGQKIGEKNWQLADNFIEARGGIAVAISRFLPVLHSLVPVVAGATKMRYRVFIRWTFAACAVWASLYVGVGYLAKSSYEQIGGTLKFGAVAFIAIILIFMTLVHFAKKRLEKTAVRMVEDDKAEKFNKLEG